MLSALHVRFGVTLLAVCAGCLLPVGCNGSDDEQAEGPSGGDTPRIAVIPKGTTHVFWQSVEAGAKRAGAEHDVRVIWKGPLSENDLSQQKSIVETFIAQGVDAIVLAPLNEVALAGDVRDARAAGIEVVIIDSAVQGEPGEDFASFVATDNEAAGRMGAEKLAELLDERGDVVLLRYEAGHASTGSRERGFVERINEYPNINLLVDNQRGGPGQDTAQRAAENMLRQLRRADGIFTVNESTTSGMLLALQQHDLAGQKTFVGFDAAPRLIDGLRDGAIDALVVQNPHRMGYEGVTAAVRALRGETVEPTIDTGVAVVTPDNVDDPAIQRMIAPE